MILNSTTMNIDKTNESIPYFKGKELIDVTQEDIEGLKNKGLRITKLNYSYPAEGLKDAIQYNILGYVDPKSGEYIDDNRVQSGGMGRGMAERDVSVIFSPDTGLAYLDSTYSSTGDPVENRDLATSAKMLEKLCTK